MCLATVEWLNHDLEKLTRRPSKTIYAWKYIRYGTGGKYSISRNLTFDGTTRTGQWAKAVRMASKSAVADVGFHVYPTRAEARRAEASTGRPGKKLVKVEVAGLISHGLGDGYDRSVRTAVYRWIRIPRGPKGGK